MSRIDQILSFLRRLLGDAAQLAPSGGAIATEISNATVHFTAASNSIQTGRMLDARASLTQTLTGFEKIKGDILVAIILNNREDRCTKNYVSLQNTITLFLGGIDILLTTVRNVINKNSAQAAA